MYKTAFDIIFRKDRNKIENIWAHLTNSWNVLKCLNFTISYASQIITVCCVQHNFCRMNNKQLTSGKVVDAYLNLNELRVPRESNIEKAFGLVAIAIWQAILDD